MLKKSLLLIFALGIIGQAGLMVLGFSWLTSKSDTETLGPTQPSASSSMVIDDENQLWVSDFHKIDVFKDGQVVRSYAKDQISGEPGRLLKGPGKEIWNAASEKGGGLAVFDGQTWSHVDGVEGLYPLGAAVDPSGQVWLIGGEPDALYRYDGNKWTSFPLSDSGLQALVIEAIAFDSQGRAWVGTNGGAAIFDGQGWQALPDSPLGGKRVLAFGFGQHGRTWFGTANDGLYEFDGSTWTQYGTGNSQLRTDEVSQLVIDQKGQIWVAGQHSAVQVFDGKSWKTWEGHAFGITSMIMAPDGSIYLRDNDTLQRIQPETRPVSRVEETLLTIYASGLPIFITMLLAGVWLMIALNAWGMWPVLAGGLIVYSLVFAAGLSSAFPNSELLTLIYLNPGAAATLLGIIGALVGALFKGTAKPRAVLFGGLIGFFLALLLAGCIDAFVLVGAWLA